MLKYSANAPPALRNLFHRYEDMKVKPSYTIDVLCVGAGTYDLVYSVDRHPEPDEKKEQVFIVDSCRNLDSLPNKKSDHSLV